MLCVASSTALARLDLEIWNRCCRDRELSLNVGKFDRAKGIPRSVQKLEFTYEGPEHRESLAWETYAP
jgi:hypothetical protein